MDEDRLYIREPPYKAPRYATEMVRADLILERIAQLPTRAEIWRAVLLGATIGAGLVQCLAWLFPP